MKTNKLYYLCMGLSLLCATGCDDKMEGLAGEKTPNTQPVQLTASLDGAATRLGLTDVNDKVEVRWQEQDVLQVYTAGQPMTSFKLTEGAGTAKAVFTGTPELAYEEGQPLYAVYANNDAITPDADGNLTISLEGQDGTLNDKYQYLYAQNTYSAEGTGFQFQHIVSLIKLQLTLPEGVTSLSHVTFESYGLFHKATLLTTCIPDSMSFANLKLGDLVYSENKKNQGLYGDGQNDEVISLDGTFMPDDSGVVTLYFYVLPVRKIEETNQSNTEYHWSPSVTVTDDQGNALFLTTTLKGKSIERGKMYTMHSKLVLPSAFPNEETADGSVEQPYELRTADDLYSMMLRCSNGLTNGQKIPYNRCSYRMMSDIELNDKMLWNPFNVYGTWDGNGHQISGQITSANNSSVLFSEGSNAVVRNLTLSFSSIKFFSDAWSRSGILFNSASRCSIENCVNKSNLTSVAQVIGGLAGRAERCTFIACGNEGTLQSQSSRPTTIGGIAGEIADSCYIEACYNKGSMEFQATVSGQTGAWVGTQDETNHSLNACWSAGGYSMGNFQNSFSLEAGATPSAEQIETMNAVMKNNQWRFGESGTLVPYTPPTTSEE